MNKPFLSNQTFENNSNKSEIKSDPLQHDSSKNEKEPKSKRNKREIQSNSQFVWKDETKLLKYALKISELEFKAQQNKEKSKLSIPITYSDFPSTNTFHSDEIDFLDFSGYIDNCWKSQENDMGIFKIIPPEEWKENYKKSYHLTVTDYLRKDQSKKFYYRKQKLHEFHKGENFEHTKEILFDSFLTYANLIYNSISKSLFKERKTRQETSQGHQGNSVNDKNIEVDEGDSAEITRKLEEEITNYIGSNDLIHDLEEKYWEYVKSKEESKGYY